eukprot:4655337-Alexandrium_andersonii.AAC.1
MHGAFLQVAAAEEVLRQRAQVAEALKAGEGGRRWQAMEWRSRIRTAPLVGRMPNVQRLAYQALLGLRIQPKSAQRRSMRC